ncbi:MAG: hypothetical protein C0436_03200 [Alphaproteobacteria bacterium]|nr:hypothetical protein [Alphaproteobacteria bacterium]
MTEAIARSKAERYIILREGTELLPHAIETHCAYLGHITTTDVATFSDYRLRGKDTQLASIDPADVHARLGTGYAIEPSTLCFSREQWRKYADNEAGTLDAALMRFTYRLAQAVPCIHHASLLLQSSRPLHYTRREARILHRLWASQHGADVALLCEAAAWHASRTNIACAKEALRQAGWNLGNGVFALKTLLRLMARRLPHSVKRLLPRPATSHIGHRGERLDFNEIYHANGFCGTESRSGAGSTHFQTRIIREQLPALMKTWGAHSMLDIPCGDFHWMCEVDLSGVDYIGADLVPAMVEANQKRYGNEKRKFVTLDLLQGPLPEVDVIFCRDCLVHLPFVDACAALDVIRKSKATWLFTTHFTRDEKNHELDTNGWRALNLCKPPFNLPPPHFTLSERCTEAGGKAADKTLALWRISDLVAIQNAA